MKGGTSPTTESNHKRKKNDRPGLETVDERRNENRKKKEVGEI